MTHPSLEFNLKRAAIHLSAAQGLVEAFPKEYSEQTWSLLTDALSIITALEVRTHQEETTHPADSDHDFI